MNPYPHPQQQPPQQQNGLVPRQANRHTQFYLTTAGTVINDVQAVSIAASYGQQHVQRQIRQTWNSNLSGANEQNHQNQQQVQQQQQQLQGAQHRGNFANNRGDFNGGHGAMPLGAGPAAGGMQFEQARGQPNNNPNDANVSNIANDQNGRLGGNGRHGGHGRDARDARDQNVNAAQVNGRNGPNGGNDGFDANNGNIGNIASVANVANVVNAANGGNQGNGNDRNGRQVGVAREEKENGDRRRNIRINAREAHNRAVRQLDDNARQRLVGRGGQEIIRTIMMEAEWQRNQTSGNVRERFIRLILFYGGLSVFAAVGAYFEAYRQAAPSWNANIPRARLHQLKLQFSTHVALSQPNQQ